MDRTAAIDDFFVRYAGRFNRGLSGAEPDVEETVNSFAECFVESSPAGIICGKNDETFREKIPEGYKFYRSIGTESMEIRSRNITLLDEFHALVKVHWFSVYRTKDDTKVEIEFDVFYLLQTMEQIRIFAYITGDEQAVLREKGLITDN